MLLYNPTTQPVHFHAAPRPSLKVEPLGMMIDPVTGEKKAGIYVIDVVDGDARFQQYIQMGMLNKFIYTGKAVIDVYRVKDDTFYQINPKNAEEKPKEEAPKPKKKKPEPVEEPEEEEPEEEEPEEEEPEEEEPEDDEEDEYDEEDEEKPVVKKKVVKKKVVKKKRRKNT